MTTQAEERSLDADTTVANDWVKVARSFAPQIEAARDPVERGRRVPSDLIGAMVDAGLFRLQTPRAYGGEEVSFITLCRVVEEVSKVDGSVGWTLLIANHGGYFAGYLPEEAAAEIYGSDPRVIIAGSGFLRQARAVPVEGGYRLEGRWGFASGCPEATWMNGGSLVFTDSGPRLGPDGMPEVRVFFLPKRDCEIIDTWDAVGLRGTASHDFEVHSAFVPERRQCLLQAVSHLPGPLWRDSFLGVVAHSNAAVSLGIARAAIDDLILLAATKTPSASSTQLRDRPTIQAKVAQAEALLRSARSFFYETLEAVWESACRGEGPSAEQAALSQLARVHAAHACAEAVDLMYSAAGSTALYATSRIERCFRDVHAVTQHMVVSPLGWEQAGRVFLGLEMGGR